MLKQTPLPFLAVRQAVFLAVFWQLVTSRLSPSPLFSPWGAITRIMLSIRVLIAANELAAICGKRNTPLGISVTTLPRLCSSSPSLYSYCIHLILHHRIISANHRMTDSTIQRKKSSSPTTVVQYPAQADGSLTTRGHAQDGQEIVDSIRPALPPKPARLCVGIKGNWYDLTAYIRGGHHPGGDVINEFVGRDASAHFMAYHDIKVLGKRRPVGTYEWDSDKPGGDPLQGAWFRLNERFERLGYFEGSYSYLASRLLIIACFATATVFCIRSYLNDGGSLPFYVGALCWGAITQQFGFLLHDFMHNHYFQDRKWNHRCGWIAGIMFGIPSLWWRDEHHGMLLYLCGFT